MTSKSDRITDMPLRPVRHPSLPTESELTALHEIMTRDVVCIRPDLMADSLADLFLVRNISAVPVVDADGYPIGVASKTDLVRWYRDEAGFRPARVYDLMMPLAFTLNEDAPIAYAAALMAVEGIHHLPIVSNEGHVVGIVSALDLVRWMAQRDGYLAGSRTVMTGQ